MKNKIIVYLLIVTFYVISGKAALMLALPPGYVSAIFPPAGIAVAATFMGGRKTLPWVLLGSFLLNLWVGYSTRHQIDATGVGAAALIAVASMLQAATGGWVLRRAIGYPAAFDNIRDIFRFLLLSPVVCLVSASLSVVGLGGIGVFEADSLAVNWLSWWIGDTLGVLVMLPLAMIAAGEPRALWRSRMLTVAVPMLLVFMLFVMIFLKADQWENNDSLMEFRQLSQQTVNEIKSEFEEQEAVLIQMAALFTHDAHNQVSREEFHRFTEKSLARFPMIKALEWAFPVKASQRANFEATQRKDFPGFEIRERSAEEQMQRAGKRDSFYPVTYIEPLAGNEPAMGFDLASNLKRQDAVNKAMQSETVVLSAPLNLVQERQQQAGVLMLMAVNPRDNKAGIVLSVLRMGDMIAPLLRDTRPMLYTRLIDLDEQKTIYDDFAPEVQRALYERTFDFGSRRYRLETAPTPGYFRQHRGWQSWSVLAAGILGTSLLGALLLLGTGYTVRMESQVKDRTRKLKESESRFRNILEHAPIGMGIASPDGRLLQVNQALCAMLGYEKEELEKLSIHDIIYPEDKAFSLANVKRLLDGEVDYYQSEKRYLRRDGQTVWGQLASSIERDDSGLPLYLIDQIEDISDRKRLQQQLTVRLRHLDVMERISRICLNSTSIEELQGKVLDEVLGIFEADRAWFLYPCDPDASSWSVPMERTRPEWPGAFAREMTIPMTPEVAEIFREVLASSTPLPYGPAASRSIPAEVVAQFSVQSQIQMALHPKVGSPWAMGLHHCAQAQVYDENDLLIFRDIGQRVADALNSLIMLNSLRESDETLNRAQEVGQIGSWRFDIPSERLEWSAETYRMFGIPEQQPINLEIFVAAIHADDRDFVLNAWAETIAADAPYEIEHRIVVDGQERWVRERAKIERDQEGRPLSGIGTVQDITERKQAEELLRKSSEEIEDLYNHAPCGYHSLDKDGFITRINDTELEWLGYAREEVIGKMKLSDLFTPASKESFQRNFPFAKKRGFIKDFENEMVRKDGSILYGLVNSTIVYDASGNYQNCRSTVFDITERKRTEETLRSLFTALEHSPIAVIITDSNTNIQYVSPRFSEITGYASTDVTGRNLRILQAEWMPKHTYLEMWSTLSSGLSWHGELLSRSKQGRMYWEDVHVTPVRAAAENVVNYVVVIADITERKTAEEKMQHLANYDTLTDLPNRLLVDDRMRQALVAARRDRTRMALMFLDLDKFKPINDLLGHDVGDLLLKEAAMRMQNSVRESDTVGRIGGDEFVVLLPTIDSDEHAMLVANKIRDALSQPFALAGQDLHISSSIGVAIYPEHGDNGKALIKNADAAMYYAKERGRDSAHLFNPKMRTE